jgi:hypothetical protein
MKSVHFTIIPVLGATLFAGCAVQAEDSQSEEDGQSVRSIAEAPASSDVAASSVVLDGRAAAAAGTSTLGARTVVASSSLDSSWFSGSVAPGATQHWVWNNASLTAAYKVGLSPVGASTTSPCQFQVTRAWDVQQHTGEREFHFDIKNTGAITCGTDILLASQQRSNTWSTGGINAGATQNWTWNNANPLTASHLVGLSPTGSTSTDTCQLEVTRSWYLQQPTGEREFHFTVKNAGAIACEGDVQLALATAADSSWSTGTLSPGASGSWVWNNANPLDRVYVPGLSPTGASESSTCQLEITDTTYQQMIKSDGTAERRFFLTVKNSGSLACSGTILLNHL